MFIIRPIIRLLQDSDHKRPDHHGLLWLLRGWQVVWSHLPHPQLRLNFSLLQCELKYWKFLYSVVRLLEGILLKKTIFCSTSLCSFVTYAWELNSGTHTSLLLWKLTRIPSIHSVTKVILLTGLSVLIRIMDHYCVRSVGFCVCVCVSEWQLHLMIQQLMTVRTGCVYHRLKCISQMRTINLGCAVQCVIWNMEVTATWKLIGCFFHLSFIQVDSGYLCLFYENREWTLCTSPHSLLKLMRYFSSYHFMFFYNLNYIYNYKRIRSTAQLQYWGFFKGVFFVDDHY